MGEGAFLGGGKKARGRRSKPPAPPPASPVLTTSFSSARHLSQWLCMCWGGGGGVGFRIRRKPSELFAELSRCWHCLFVSGLVLQTDTDAEEECALLPVPSLAMPSTDPRGASPPPPKCLASF